MSPRFLPRRAAPRRKRRRCTSRISRRTRRGRPGSSPSSAFGSGVPTASSMGGSCRRGSTRSSPRRPPVPAKRNGRGRSSRRRSPDSPLRRNISPWSSTTPSSTGSRGRPRRPPRCWKSIWRRAAGVPVGGPLSPRAGRMEGGTPRRGAQGVSRNRGGGCAPGDGGPGAVPRRVDRRGRGGSRGGDGIVRTSQGRPGRFDPAGGNLPVRLRSLPDRPARRGDRGVRGRGDGWRRHGGARPASVLEGAGASRRRQGGGGGADLRGPRPETRSPGSTRSSRFRSGERRRSGSSTPPPTARRRRAARSANGSGRESGRRTGDRPTPRRFGGRNG